MNTKQTQIIKSESSEILKVGPLKFNDDWPGIFLSQSFIKQHFIDENIPFVNENLEESIGGKNLFNHFNDMMISMFMKSVRDNQVVSTSPEFDKYEIVEQVQVVIVKGSKRIETGSILVNNQPGYFVRGDNAFGLISSFEILYKSGNGNIFYKEMVKILSSAML